MSTCGQPVWLLSSSTTSLRLPNGVRFVACATDEVAPSGLSSARGGCRSRYSHRNVVGLRGRRRGPGQGSARTLSTLGGHVLESVRELVSPKMIDSMGMAHFRGAQVDMESGQIRSGWNVGDGDSRWRNWLSGACLAFSVAAYAELDGFRGRPFSTGRT